MWNFLKNPEQHLFYRPNGTINPLNGSEKGKVFIEDFDYLNHDDRIENRLKEIKGFQGEFRKGLTKAIEHWQENIHAYNHEETYYYVNHEYLGRWFRLLEKWGGSEIRSEFKLLYRNMIEHFEEFIIEDGNYIVSEKEFLRLLYQKIIEKQDIPISRLTEQMKRILEAQKRINYSNRFIDYFKVEHYFCIENIELQDLGDKKEIYFLGENGDGKTVLLQSLVLALKIQGIKNNTNQTELGTILQYISENQRLNLHSVDQNNIEYNYSKTQSKGTSYLENIYAYGCNRYRRNSLEFIDKHGYLTLFEDNQELLSPVEWLKIVKLEEEFSALKLEKAISLLEDLLDNNLEINLRGSQVTFTERGASILWFDQLSDGYKSVMTWVTDLVARLAKRQPKAVLQDYEAVVLVDEIGLHLHPKWEARLVKRLRTWFPKIQFFFTTHSPTLILSASEDAIFYRIYKKEGVSKISESFACSDLSDLMLNGIVTSPLFDLENATMRSFDPKKDELDTTSHYRSNRIRKIVDEEIQQLKEKKVVYISPQMLDDIIKKAIEKNV